MPFRTCGIRVRFAAPLSHAPTRRNPFRFPAYPPEIHKLYQYFIPRFLSCCTAFGLHDSLGRATVLSPQEVARQGAGRDGRGGRSGLIRALTNPVGTQGNPGRARRGRGLRTADPNWSSKGVAGRNGSQEARRQLRSARAAATGPENLATGGTGQEGIRRHRKVPRKDRVRAPDAFSWPVRLFSPRKVRARAPERHPGPFGLGRCTASMHLWHYL